MLFLLKHGRDSFPFSGVVTQMVHFPRGILPHWSGKGVKRNPELLAFGRMKKVFANGDESFIIIMDV